MATKIRSESEQEYVNPVERKRVCDRVFADGGGALAHLTPRVGSASSLAPERLLPGGALARARLRLRQLRLLDLALPLKQTGFPKGQLDSLYRRDSPWISSYHIQNSFQLNITDISHVYNITLVYLIHNPNDCITNLRVQAPWAKRKQTESGNNI